MVIRRRCVGRHAGASECGARSMSFGSPTKSEKFYKGAKNDTVWNKDLLWQKHVTKEIKQSKINSGELPPDPALRTHHRRMTMGITGTLIPSITPRYSEKPGELTALVSLSSRRRLGSEDGEDTRTIVSRARSDRFVSSGSHKSLLGSRAASVLTTSSSHHSLRLEDVQDLVDNQSRQLKEKTEEEMRVLRDALQSESRKREAAEKKLTMLCEKLGMD